MPSRYPGTKAEVFVFRSTPRGRRFLALQRATFHKDQWHPVTGKVERGESVEQAAFREVEEETGIRDALRLIDSGYGFDFDGEGQHWSERVFGLEVTGETVKLSNEHQAYRWVSDGEMSRLLNFSNQREGLRQLLERI